MLDYPILLIFPAALAFAGAMDLFTMTIPNRISLVLVGVFGIAAYFAGLSTNALMSHLGAGALMLCVGIGMFARGWVGGGDAKLLAAASLWLGFEVLLPFLLITGVVGSFLTLVILSYRNYPADAFPLPDWALHLHRPQTGLPYGLAIAAAGLMVFPESALFAGLVL